METQTVVDLKQVIKEKDRAIERANLTAMAQVEMYFQQQLAPLFEKFPTLRLIYARLMWFESGKSMDFPKFHLTWSGPTGEEAYGAVVAAFEHEVSEIRRVLESFGVPSGYRKGLGYFAVITATAEEVNINFLVSVTVAPE